MISTSAVLGAEVDETLLQMQKMYGRCNAMLFDEAQLEPALNVDARDNNHGTIEQRVCGLTFSLHALDEAVGEQFRLVTEAKTYGHLRTRKVGADT